MRKYTVVLKQDEKEFYVAFVLAKDVKEAYAVSVKELGKKAEHVVTFTGHHNIAAYWFDKVD